MADEARLEAEEADFETSKGVKVVNTFDGLKLRDDLLRGVYAYGVFLARGQSRWKAPPCLAILLAVVRSGSFWFGFEKPSAIQQRAILPMSQGRNVIAQSQSEIEW
ncbi:hypothetical protein T484DRAFT_1916557, partial [Baffinella frigidus]